MSKWKPKPSKILSPPSRTIPKPVSDPKKVTVSAPAEKSGE